MPIPADPRKGCGPMIQQQLDAFRAARFLRNPQEIRTFISTLREIEGDRNLTRDQVEDLYRILEDSPDNQELFWGILHLIEDQGQNIWLSAFVAVLPEMKSKSPEWADTISSRILNGEQSRPAFATLLKNASASRTAVLPILQELSKEQDPDLQRLRQNAEHLLAELRS